MSSILDDYSYIKKKMEEIKAEESAVNAKQANPAGNDPQANPPAQTQPGVWSTGMKGSGIGCNASYEAEHYDPYGNPLYYNTGREWTEVPTQYLWPVEVTPIPHVDTMQKYMEMMEWVRQALDQITYLDLSNLMSDAELRMYDSMQRTEKVYATQAEPVNQAQENNQGATPNYSKPSQGQGVLGSEPVSVRFRSKT